MKRLLSILLITIALPLGAAVEYHPFDDPKKEETYQTLISELRCLVCQNQTIADSNADLAKDLRNQVYGMLQQGKSKDDVVDFMTQRYGDFVLYRPPVKPITWLLWIGPLLILLGGGLFLWRRHAHSRPVEDDGMTEAEHQRLERLKSELLHKDES